MTCVAFCATDGDQGAILQLRSCVAASHDRRNAQFTGNDGGVTSAAPAVGHNGTGPLHHRLPIGVGHVGDQHITRLHLVHLSNAVHQTNGASANLLTNGTPFGQYGALAFEFVAQLGGAFGLTLDCLGPGLQDVQQAIGAILAPFNVHGAAIVLFNHHGVLRQLRNVCVAQRITVAQLHAHFYRLDQLARCRFFFGC